MKDQIRQNIQKSINTKEMMLSCDQLVSEIQNLTHICISTIQNNRKIILIGNGGSAADAQHLAAEFITRLNFDRPCIPAIALSTDTSVLTAIGNDYSFEDIFSRQIEAIGNHNDLLIAISTSGNSTNIVKAAQLAQKKEIRFASFCGFIGGIAPDIDILIQSDSNPLLFIEYHRHFTHSLNVKCCYTYSIIFIISQTSNSIFVSITTHQHIIFQYFNT